jgi:uncharacterized protein (DUF58 family)
MTVLRIAALISLVAAIYALVSPLAVAIFLVVLAGAARYLPQRALSDVVVERRYPGRLFHGETAEMELVVTNHGRLPLPWLWIVDSLPFDLSTRSARWATSLDPGEQRMHRFPLHGARRGLYRLGPAALVTGDVFGWRPTQRGASESDRMVVYPKIVPLTRLGLPARAPFPELRTSRPLHEDPNRVVGTRPYTTGDSARRINWTATAHQGSLLVRQLQHGIGRDTMVLLDLTREGLGTTRAHTVELAVTAAASVLYHIITVERLPVGLRLPGISVPPSNQQNHLMAMLELLAGAVMNNTGSPVSDPTGLPYGASVVVIAGRLTPGWQSSLETLRHGNWRPSVLLVGDREPVRLRGIPVWWVDADRELAENLAGSQR